MGEWSELTAKDHQVLREDVGLEALPVQLSLKAEKGLRESDRRRAVHGKKSTRYKNVDAQRPSAKRR
jgi:hypothetical protein